MMEAWFPRVYVPMPAARLVPPDVVGVSGRVRALLRTNPTTSYTLAEVRTGAGVDVLLCELSSVMSKLVHRGDVTRTRALMSHPRYPVRGRRIWTFRWAK